jgi:peptidoglycan/LPS O-acetylase OafA/YrhL
MGVRGFDGGFVGVDIFFVISGYLITSMLTRQIDAGQFTLGHFYERRIRRIIPAFAAMALATSCVAAVLLAPGALAAYGKSLVAATLSLSNVYFWKTAGYFDLQATQAPLLHTWSLAVEEQFYLVVPLYLAWMRRWKIAWLKIIAPVVIFSFLIGQITIKLSENAAFYMPFGRFWEPGVGALLSVIKPMPDRFRRLGLHNGMAAVGLVLIAGSIYFFTEAMEFPGYIAALPCLGAALLIFSNEGGATITGRCLSLPPMRYIGLMSYSLYLWHWPILVFCRMLLPEGPAWNETSILLCVISGAGVLSWRYIERPFRRSIRVSRREIFLATGLAASLALVIGASLWLSDSAAFRVAPQARRFQAAQGDINPDRRRCDSPSVERITRGEICKLGATTGPTHAALLGDSFGDALAPGISAAAAARGERVAIYSHSGCRPYVGLTSEGTCRQRAEASVRAIASDPNITLVIYVQRWSAHVEGIRLGATRQPAKYMRDAYTAVPGPDENLRVFHRSLDRTIKALGRRRIVVITGMPEQDVVVPFSAFARAQLGLQPPPGVATQKYRARRAKTDLALNQAQKRNGFDILDLDAAMCNSVRCPAVDEGGARYVDDNHPSRSQAVRLGRLFAPLFGGHIEPARNCQGPQLLRGRVYDEQHDERVCTGGS